MKPTTLLLAASLIANVALVGVFYSGRASGPASAATRSGESAAKSSGAAKSDASRATAGTADTSAEAAGLAPEATRQLNLGRAFARFAAAMRAATGKSTDGKWWVRLDPSRTTREQRDQLAQAKREMSDAMIAATGSDLFNGNNLTEANISFLPEAKRDQLRKILSDYQDMMDQYGSAGGIQLASDREKMKLLRGEREHDIAALLSPDELADYQMRTSPSADSLRNRYGNAIASEDDFKKLYALQKAYDDKFSMESFNGRVTQDQMKARSDAAAQLQSDMRAAVGDDAYAVLKRASDSDLRTVDALVARLNLAPDTTDRVAATRDSYAAESQRIMADAATPFPQRRDQLQALATRAKSDLSSELGAEAADAYAQRSQWVSMLQGGMGFSTTPPANGPGALSLAGVGGASPSVYPVTPAGAPGTRVGQVMNVVTSSGPVPGASPDGGAVFFSNDAGGGGRTMAATQVYSFTTTGTSSTIAGASTSDGRPIPDSGGTVMITKIAPPPPDAPAQQPAPPPKE